MNYIDNYFAKATVKESIEEAMENTKEMECSVVTCKKVRCVSDLRIFSLSELPAFLVWLHGDFAGGSVLQREA